MIVWLNEITAPPTMVIWFLVSRGFWPHLRFRGTGPLHYMVQGVSIVSAVLILRMFYWDLARPAMRYFELLPQINQSVMNALFNGGFNIAVMIAGYLILLGLYWTLPADERGRYSPFTAPFYPRGILFFRKDRS